MLKDQLSLDEILKLSEKVEYWRREYFSSSALYPTFEGRGIIVRIWLEEAYSWAVSDGIFIIFSHAYFGGFDLKFKGLEGNYYGVSTRFRGMELGHHQHPESNINGADIRSFYSSIPKRNENYAKKVSNRDQIEGLRTARQLLKGP